MKNINVNGEAGVVYVEGAAPASGSSTGVLLTKYDRFYRFVYSALVTQITHEKYMDVFD